MCNRYMLSKFDLDGDGILDSTEIHMAFEAYEDKIEAMKTGSIPFSRFLHHPRE
jgi:hypothetical protein